MNTTLFYFFELWRGPLMSNAETNKLLYHLLDCSGYETDSDALLAMWTLFNLAPR